MTKENLFVFWLGDKKGFDIKRYESKHFNVIVGPSQSEHDYLYEKYSYYRDGFNNKKFSFCSDIWRLYILEKNRGLYVDASVLIGKKVEDFLNEITKYDVVAFRGNFKMIESGVLWSGKSNNKFYGEILKMYEKNIPIYSFIMPVFLSKSFYENGFTPGWERQINGSMKLDTLFEIRNKNSIWKTCVGSWSNKGVKGNYFEQADNFDCWAHKENIYRSKIKDWYWNVKVERALSGGIIDVWMIRKFYDGNVMNRKFLSKEYKKLNYKIKFNERLIWSKLYVFFTFKWLKSKK